jgi:hypothetical protein
MTRLLYRVSSDATLVIALKNNVAVIQVSSGATLIKTSKYDTDVIQSVQ